jgi:opacity protein-like surface antigen
MGMLNRLKILTFIYLIISTSATVGSTTVSVNDSAFSYGIGAEWKLSEQTGIRLDYTTADYGVTDASVLALTSVIRF